jgi:hypothetical protein
VLAAAFTLSAPSVNARTLVQVGALTFDRTKFHSGVIDTAHGFAYFAGMCCEPGVYSQDHETIVKIDLSTFSLVSKTTGTGSDPALIDQAAGFAYVVGGLVHREIFKVRLSNLTVVTSHTLLTGEGGFGCALIDSEQGFAYFATNQPLISDIVRVRLSDFDKWNLETTGVARFTTFEGSIGLACVLDAANGFAYFGTDTSPGKILKIRLSDFTQVGVLTLNAGEDFLRTAVVDPPNGFAYFVTEAGLVVKIRLSNFTESATLKLPGEIYATSASIDHSQGVAYFGTVASPYYTSIPSQLVKVRLADFTLNETVMMSADEPATGPAVIDERNGYMYLSSGWDQPADKILKFSIKELPKVMETTTNNMKNTSQVGTLAARQVLFASEPDRSIPLGVILGLLVSVPTVVFRLRRLRR